MCTVTDMKQLTPYFHIQGNKLRSTNISMGTDTHDPLAKPMVNLILIGDITSHSQYILDEFGKMIMLKEAFTLSLREQSGEVCRMHIPKV